MKQLKDRWRAAGYSHLELAGLYWLSEGVPNYDTYDVKLVQTMSKLVHRERLPFFWIPYFYGGNNANWDVYI